MTEWPEWPKHIEHIYISVCKLMYTRKAFLSGPAPPGHLTDSEPGYLVLIGAAYTVILGHNSIERGAGHHGTVGARARESDSRHRQ